jgi:hypothetical protein
MDHTTRTIIFGVAAVVAVSMGFATSIWVEPKDPDKFSDEGTEFFPKFTDPGQAKSIEVSIFNQASSSAETFRVAFKDGLWTIPSHNDYPADGEEQLGKTAASVIGITRDSLESESKDDHEAMGVVDPLDDTIASGEGRGTKVKLLDGEGNTLVDYIIGKPAEDDPTRYYIRNAEEERTYLVKLDINLSTRFADWVEPDLLDVERNDIIDLYIDDYALVEKKLPDGSNELDIEEGERMRLHRESGGFQWTLDGLDAATETLKTGVVNAMLTALDDLRFIGVRPKPDFFDAVLRGEVQVSPTDLSLIARSLQAKGYYLTRPSADGNLGLFSREGSLVVGTADGVSYQLLVGNVFVGTQTEIEIGGESEEAAETSEPAEEPPAEGDSAADDASGAEDTEAAENEAATEEELAPGEQRSRYLFILTEFDEALLGPRPEPPVMPMPPGAPADSASEGEPAEEASETEAAAETATEADAGEAPAEDAPETTPEASDTEADAEEETAEQAPQCDDPAVTDDSETADDDTAVADEPLDDAAEAEEATGDEPVTQQDDAAATTDEAQPVDDAADTAEGAETPAEPTAEELQAAYDAAMREYETALDQYERDLADYEERIEAGKKKVEDLRARFQLWYYVIPADVFDDLNVSRSGLVEPKAADDAAGPDGAPDFELPGLPDLPEVQGDLPDLPMPEGTDGDTAEPMPEGSESGDTTEESVDPPADGDAEAEAEATDTTTTPEGAEETPDADASQSGESGETPAAESDSETDPPTME